MRRFIVRYRIKEHDDYGHIVFKYRQKTVYANEINEAIRTFIKETRLSVLTYISTVRQGRTYYQWHDVARDAFPADYRF